ncbi:glycan-binding surface protein [Labilibaculum sp. K2S]|uniref:glycan-binding surface protein n=1 Tax=Labilibaculum sp. K2S TaxID=3056386 RepID=UPI0025A3E2DA|nr:glycan-binding surface protein [Labilibaculum sp. K2S]MDM8158396.1 glycan-binding surface protein [Labilibaculum sp. K2S]
MKNILKILSLLFVVILGFTACNDDDNDGGTPSIQYIRPTEAAASDSLLVSASMGQTIAIIGEGLQDVVSIYFNDQQAKLNPTYVTSHSIVVTVPGSIPDEITNTITLSTSSGKSLVYDFTTKITPPKIKSVSCEWAKDNSEITLYGSYFFPTEEGDIEVLFPGNLQAEVVEFTDEYITAVVPKGAMKGYITVTNDYGMGRTSFIFRDDADIFIDGENPTAWNNWGLSDFASAEGIDGSYVNFEGTTGSWAWPANAIQLFYINPNAQPLVSEGDASDYVLKFECYCHEWHDTPMLIWFDNDGSHNVDGANAQYHWKAYNNNGVSENYVTDGWITVTMPISDFIYSKDESETDRAITSLDELQNLNIMWFGSVNESTTEFGLKMWIDNVRLVNSKE